jgi:predicted dehydrogenase
MTFEREMTVASEPDGNTKLRAAVIGAGHMGRHHVRIYSELPDTELVAVVDTDLARAGELAEKYQTKACAAASEIIDQVDIVTIAVPTVAHLKVAQPFIEAGKAVLIEKPLAFSVDEAREIVRLAEKHHTLVQVGHSERFNPVVRAMQRMGIVPRFIESQRISPFTFRSADIGVVMDMMIHDIDIVLSLTGQPVVSVDAVGVSVLSSHEDIANARLTFADGCVANLTASRLALKTERKIRVFSNEAYLNLDYQRRTGLAIKKDTNSDVLKVARERNIQDLAELAGFDYSKLVKVEPLVIADEEPLRAEILAFIAAVRNNTEPAVSAKDGLAAVETADRIVQSIKEHNWQLT